MKMLFNIMFLWHVPDDGGHVLNNLRSKLNF